LIKNLDYSFDYIFFFVGAFFALSANLFLAYNNLEDLGLFNKSFAIFIIFGQLFLFSIHDNLVKNLILEKNRVKYLSSIFFVLFCSIIFCIFFFIVIDFFDVGKNLFVGINFIIFSISIPFFIFNKVLFAILNADKKFHLYFFLNNLRPILIFVILIILYLNKINITIVFFICEIIILFINLFFYKKFNILIKINMIDFFLVKKIVIFNFLSLPHSLLSYSFLRIDVIVLSFFVDLKTLGFYSFSAMIIEGIYQLLTMMRDRVNPELSKSLTIKTYKISSYLKKILLNVLMFVSIFIIVYYIFFPLFSYFSNKDFLLSRNIFFIISIGLFIFSLSSVIEHIFLMNNKPLYQSTYIIFGNLLNITLNIVLINIFGVYGAAAATCISYALLSFIILYYSLIVSKKNSKS
jgi:O-antigen/teichoic acid export membrane protein